MIGSMIALRIREKKNIRSIQSQQGAQRSHAGSVEITVYPNAKNTDLLILQV